MELIRRYRGFRFPLFFWEREILSSRYRDTTFSSYLDRLTQFEKLISNGEIIAKPGRVADTGNRYVEFHMRGEGHVFADQQAMSNATGNLSAAARTVFDFLKENGSSYGRDLQWATGLSPAALNAALQQLADNGLVGCENYQSFTAIVQSSIAFSSNNSLPPLPKDRDRRPLPGRQRRHSGKRQIRQLIREHSRITDGRWFLTTSLAIAGKPVDNQQRAELQARLLLRRYGILVKEWYRREQSLLPWYQIFQVLKRLEWQGEIRRGYFVSGLSGLQFALPEALELLEKMTRQTDKGYSDPMLLSTLDPALPFGGGVEWGIVDPGGKPYKVMRSASNHLVFMEGRAIMACEHYFRRILVLEELSRRTWQKFSQLARGYLKIPSPLRPVNRIEIQQINYLPAAPNPLAHHLVESGFEIDGNKLVLWPSAM
jgi:ATP-dependent Lhr-like helicase